MADGCDFKVTDILYHVDNKEGLMEATLAAMDRRLFNAAAEELDRDATNFELGNRVRAVHIGDLSRVPVRATVRDPEAALAHSMRGE